MDALEVLVRHSEELGIEKLKPDEAESLRKFGDMAAKIDEMKLGGVPLSEDGVDDFVRRMRVLRHHNEMAYQRVRRQSDRLQERLAAELRP